MTRYVGVRNSVEKTHLLSAPAVGIDRAPAGDLAFDCIRHLDFLRAADAGAPLDRTLYWRYLLATGRDAAAAAERCRRFAMLYETIAAGGFDYAHGRIAVTRFGIRLNGSHRAAIAAFMGMAEVETAVHEWPPTARRKRRSGMEEEAEIKRQGQTEWVGKRVRRRDGTPLGVVVFVDAQQLRLRRRLDLALAVIDADERLLMVPARTVVAA